MKKIFIIVVLIISLVLFNKNYVIPKESIRFRIIAASNSKIDQVMKYLALKETLKTINNIENNSIEESRTSIKNSIGDIKENIEKLFNKENYDEEVNINYGYNEFPQKTYKGVTYESGNYESLVITIGEGEGKNYWCVLYPPLCLIEEENVTYKSKVIEIVNKYLKIK